MRISEENPFDLRPMKTQDCIFQISRSVENVVFKMAEANANTSSAVKRRSPMVWNAEKDVYFAREVLVVEPHKHKEKSRERAKCWTTISDNLNKITGFTVSARAIRERMDSLITKYKKKTNEEAKGSGIVVEITELDTLLEEIVERMAEYAKSYDNQKSQASSEKDVGESVRMQALEIFKDTEKRQSLDGGDCESKPKKTRNTGSDTITFLKEKLERDCETRDKELQLKKEELENQRRVNKRAIEQQNNMVTMMANSMNQMQQMTQNFMQIQQTQNQALYNVLEKLAKK